MLVVAHLHQELIICIRYYQLPEQQKTFMQTLCLVHIMLTQLQNAERVNSVWDVYVEHSLIKTTFRFFSPQGNKDSSHQSVSLQCHHHHRVIMWPSLLKLANCSATPFVLTAKWPLSFSQQIMQWSHIYLAT